MARHEYTLRGSSRTGLAALAVVAGLITLRAQQPPPPRPPASGQGEPRFKGGVELINVTATVSDSTGRFVPDLQLEDFIRLRGRRPANRDAVQRRTRAGQPRHRRSTPAAAWSARRSTRRAAPWIASRYDLLDDRDEMFLYRFSDVPVLLQGWTTDRMLVSRALGAHPAGWRHRDVRRGGRSDPPGGQRPATRRKRW